MSRDRIIEISSWVIIGSLLLWLVPKDKIRDAHLIFLFKQVLTWILGLMVAEKNLIRYPVRIFSRATKSSFTFDYFAYPAICVFFNLFYPYGESIEKQLVHYITYTSGITIFEVTLERYTNLIKYINWKWYWTWATIFITFMMSNFYYRWFFQF